MRFASPASILVLAALTGCSGSTMVVAEASDAGDDATTTDAADAPANDTTSGDDAAADAPADATPQEAAVDAVQSDTRPDAVVSETASDAAADSPPACLAAGACSGFPSSFINDATAVANCAGATHQINCCGARRVFGINHGERTTFCPAEATCRSAYPATPGCSDATLTTDTGETTTDPNAVRVRCVNPSGGKCTCQTFVCADATCMATSVPTGSCGP